MLHKLATNNAPAPAPKPPRVDGATAGNPDIPSPTRANLTRRGQSEGATFEAGADHGGARRRSGQGSPGSAGPEGSHARSLGQAGNATAALANGTSASVLLLARDPSANSTARRERRLRRGMVQLLALGRM